MTQDEIIEMAKQAGASPDGKLWLMYAEELESFAKLVAAKAIAGESQERNFCTRCGKRTADLTTIHTCTPPKD